MNIVIGVIVVAFVLGLIYVSQTNYNKAMKKTG